MHHKYPAEHFLMLGCLFISARALAGPPLATDDPGILDPGQWEVIAATSVSAFGSGDIYELPIIDVSVGVIEDHLQLTAAYRYVTADPDDGGSRANFGNPEFGLTWRFWHTDRVQVALAPLLAFGISRPLAEVGIGDDTNVLQLPLALEYQMNDRWQFNGAFSYFGVEGGPDGWGYSGAVAYSLNGRWELLAEVAGSSDEDFDEQILDLRIGFDFALTEDFHLLFSTATGVEAPDRVEELHYDLFFGLQFFF
jgi:hypothetical protein